MSLEKLAKDHAFWADERRRLKQAGQEAASRCALLKEGRNPRQNCIEATHEGWLDEISHDYGCRENTFEDAWLKSIAEGLICTHCQDVRRLRAARMNASRQLGGIRAAITRIGRTAA